MEWTNEQRRHAEKALYRKYGYLCVSVGTIIDVQCEVTALREALERTCAMARMNAVAAHPKDWKALEQDTALLTQIPK